ncbi:hypothetical protein O6H91_07G073100 [Diphasiastrum complanatum]|uniref:Uncharacterized protein n=1 Tax=Diphasiastrum complanatum TaxID=34168 RepID=A0ACC2D6S8_DIPCM|nr:hypothetical protein O6H91_07G073100 [Diphasiastrum complanatum]
MILSPWLSSWLPLLPPFLAPSVARSLFPFPLRLSPGFPFRFAVVYLVTKISPPLGASPCYSPPESASPICDGNELIRSEITLHYTLQLRSLIQKLM